MIRKKYRYTPFEKVLGLLPKLSVAECLIVRDAVEYPDAWHIRCIRKAFKEGRYESDRRVVDPNAPVMGNS